MIFFFYGDDSLRARETVRTVRHKFRSAVDRGGHNVTWLNGSDITVETFLQAVKAVGFLAPKKLIIVKNPWDAKDFKDLETVILDFLKTQKNTAAENYLLIWQEGKPAANSRLFRALRQYKYVQEFPLLEGTALDRWIKERALRHGATITQEAVNLLIASVGPNTWQLANELVKLQNYAGSAITADTVRELVTARGNDDIFQLVDALGLRQKGRAELLLEQYLQKGTDPLYLLSMIVRQFRLILRAKELSTQVQNSYAVAQGLGLHPFVARKVVEQMRRFSTAELYAIYGHLLAIDRWLKTTTVDPGALFVRMIERL